MIFEVDGELLNIEGCMQKAIKWWNDYIETGVSPVFDEKLDKAYLDIIRATDATQDSELIDVCEKAFDIAETIKEIKKDSGIDALEKELKSLEASIKKEMTTKEIASCGNYKLSKKVSEKFQWQVYYLGMGHYVKMNKEFVKNLVDELRSLFDEMKNF